jgi:hypothetical protein
MWLQNFQVLTLGKLPYSLSGLNLERNFRIDNDEILDNPAGEDNIKMYFQDYILVFEIHSVHK